MRELDRHVIENYSQVRVERGLTWAQMAEQFRRFGHHDLAEWAEANVEADKSQRAAKGTERAVKRPPQKRA